MNLKNLLITSLLISGPALGGMEKSSDEDLLFKVSSQLTTIESYLKDRQLNLSHARFEWPELENFEKELIFVVAHDPAPGQKNQELPESLRPTHFTLRLQETWSKLEESIIAMGDVIKSDEWLSLKTSMEKFFKYREEFYYQPARAMIKSGELPRKLQQLKHLGAVLVQKHDSKKHVSVRVLDPMIEELSGELNQLNRYVGQLKELRTPPKVEKKTIYHPELKKELGLFALSVFGGGVLFASLMLLIMKLFRTKPHSVIKQEEVTAGFDYDEWIKKFESHLHQFKNIEDAMVENHLEMKHVCDELRDARNKLNLADNQQDFYESLDLVNAASPKIEDYFEKVNLRKTTDASKKLVHAIVQLCQVIESGEKIKITDNKRAKQLRSEATTQKAA